MSHFQFVVIGLLGTLMCPLRAEGQQTVVLTGVVEDETGAATRTVQFSLEYAFRR
jgi:hypothetical protein